MDGRGGEIERAGAGEGGREGGGRGRKGGGGDGGVLCMCGRSF